MLKNIDVTTAVNMLYDLPVILKTETAALCDAFGRVTASDITAQMPVPPFSRSPYDGYAFRGADTSRASRENPVTLRIIEEIPAGMHPKCEISPGCAAKILTGAPIPVGADSTVKYENTEFTDTEVRIFEPVPPDTDIVRSGSDVMPGTVLARPGTVITPPVASMLANQGFASVTVYKKPVVTVISTGSELVQPGCPLRPAAIYNSNTTTLAGYLRGFGAEPADGGTVRDEPNDIARVIGAALERSDMVITTGGASVGDYDWAVTSAELLGADVMFWKTTMKPGGAVMAAVKNGKLLLSLSGNPAAAVLALLRVAAPYIKKLCGLSECFYPEIEVMLKSPYPKDSPKLRVLRGRLIIENAHAYFSESGGQGSEATSSLVGCDLLGEIPPGSPPLPKDTLIKAYRI